MDGPAKKNRGIGRALYNRLGLKHLTYHVPEHAQGLPYMLGGLALSAFVILIVSGIYLAQYYNPNQLSSNESVQFLITHVAFGNFVRSIHYWAATIAFILVVVHMIRTFISGSYKRPREFTWLIGLGLLMVTMGFIFTGTMLSLGQEGIEALQHNSEAGLLLGKVGLWFTAGFSQSLPLIGRVYIGHITILAVLFTAFIVAHFYLIKVHGMSPKATRQARVGSADREEQSHFNRHIKKLAGWSLILMALIALLALVLPESLGSPGAAGVEATKPPWMFLWIFGLENVFGIKSLIWGSGLIFLLIAIIPFIDRSPYLSPRRRPWIMVFGALIALAIIGLSVNAWNTKIEMPMEEGVIQRVENVLFPRAYAHDMPFLSFSPAVVETGGTLSVSGDGLKVGGEYDIYLKGTQKSILLGTADVEQGEDMFNADFEIPLDLPGDMYNVEMRSAKDPRVDVTATLQLAVQPSTVTAAPEMPTSQKRPIPTKEIPWIIGFIAVCLLLGLVLIR